jgi:hypothetical protein
MYLTMAVFLVPLGNSEMMSEDVMTMAMILLPLSWQLGESLIQS